MLSDLTESIEHPEFSEAEHRDWLERYYQIGKTGLVVILTA
jgi:hypothetical protein